MTCNALPGPNRRGYKSYSEKPPLISWEAMHSCAVERVDWSSNVHIVLNFRKNVTNLSIVKARRADAGRNVALPD